MSAGWTIVTSTEILTVSRPFPNVRRTGAFLNTGAGVWERVGELRRTAEAVVPLQQERRVFRRGQKEGEAPRSSRHPPRASPADPSSRPPRGHQLLIDLRLNIFGPEPSKNWGLLGFLITASLLGLSSSKNSGNRKSEVLHERKPMRELGTELLRFRCRGCF